MSKRILFKFLVVIILAPIFYLIITPPSVFGAATVPGGPGSLPLPPTPTGGGSASSCSFIDSSKPAQIRDSVCVIERLIRILAPATAIIFFIMVLMAAFRFIKSAGDPKKVANARDTLKYALFGVILVVAAWLILLLIKQVTGVNVTEVDIPQ